MTSLGYDDNIRRAVVADGGNGASRHTILIGVQTNDNVGEQIYTKEENNRQDSLEDVEDV